MWVYLWSIQKIYLNNKKDATKTDLLYQSDFDRIFEDKLFEELKIFEYAVYVHPDEL
jgi:hypothetical protein